MAEGKSGTVKIDVVNQCPFCGGRFGFSMTPQMVMHSDPMCEVFEELAPDEFLRQVRMKLNGNMSWDGSDN